jgi:methylenetetrahydrofolate reductase (NADPH)
MKISSLFRQGHRSLSFEVFPPKTSTAFASIEAATFAIAKLQPTFLSVTYGAGGGTSDFTLALAKELQEQFHLPVLAHLTCVSSSRETVAQRIREFREAGIENVMALRGDLTPELKALDRGQWSYHHAVELVNEIHQAAPEICIGGACYPEIHPESANQREDILHLKEKVDAGCSFLTTQMFFDNNLFYNFLYKIREAGILVPVLPGIMPITKATQVARAMELSHSLMPQRFKSLVDAFGAAPDAMAQAGIAYATDQIIDLFANGIPHVHVYSMNNPHVAAKILENLSHILG